MINFLFLFFSFLRLASTRVTGLALRLRPVLILISRNTHVPRQSSKPTLQPPLSHPKQSASRTRLPTTWWAQSGTGHRSSTASVSETSARKSSCRIGRWTTRAHLWKSSGTDPRQRLVTSNVLECCAGLVSPERASHRIIWWATGGGLWSYMFFLK